MTLRFKNLHVGDSFDFIAPDSRANSFFLRCVKISPRKYRDSSGTEHRIGRDLCRIWNIVTAEDSMLAAHRAGVAHFEQYRPTTATTRMGLTFHARAVCGIWIDADLVAFIAGYEGAARRARTGGI